MYQRHHRVLSFHDMTTFQIILLGRKLSSLFVVFFEKSRGNSEIIQPLAAPATGVEVPSVEVPSHPDNRYAVIS